MGAVKEQAANLYAVKLAERGYATLAIDLLCWGASEGPRNLVAPDLYAESFSAAVDWLTTQPFADPERIGAIGICGSGSFALAAAKIDPRIKAVATASMYDMGTAARQDSRPPPWTSRHVRPSALKPPLNVPPRPPAPRPSTSAAPS